MNIKVNFYGVLAEVTGHTALPLDNVEDMYSVKNKLLTLYPTLNKYPFCFCLGHTITDANLKLEEGDTVSLLPPFSGG